VTEKSGGVCLFVAPTEFPSFNNSLFSTYSTDPVSEGKGCTEHCHAILPQGGVLGDIGHPDLENTKFKRNFLLTFLFFIGNPHFYCPL
jgi:hypothetical protein